MKGIDMARQTHELTNYEHKFHHIRYNEKKMDVMEDGTTFKMDGNN